MDIEGAEVECLPGADLTTVRAICVEVHPRIVGSSAVNAMIDSLRQQGFCVDYDVSGLGTLLLTKSEVVSA